MKKTVLQWKFSSGARQAQHEYAVRKLSEKAVTPVGSAVTYAFPEHACKRCGYHQCSARCLGAGLVQPQARDTTELEFRHYRLVWIDSSIPGIPRHTVATSGEWFYGFGNTLSQWVEVHLRAVQYQFVLTPRDQHRTYGGDWVPSWRNWPLDKLKAALGSRLSACEFKLKERNWKNV